MKSIFPGYPYGIHTRCQNAGEIIHWCATYWPDPDVRSHQARLAMYLDDGQIYYVIYVRDLADYAQCALIWC